MAAVDYFLKIDGIDGESQDSKHKNEIDVQAWSWGASNATNSISSGGLGGGKVSMQSFSFTMQVNKASAKLMLACATGEHIKSAELTARKAGKDQQEFLKIKFSDLIVSSFNTGGNSSDTKGVDQIGMDFSKIEYEYKEQKADGTLGGSVKTGWDVKQNKKV